MTNSKTRLGRHGIELEARDVPAALDATFGTNGSAIFGNVNTVSPTAYGTTADGRILTVINVLNDDASSTFGIQRLDATGASDTSYDGNGTLELSSLLASKRDGLAKTDPSGNYSLSSSTLSEAPGGKWYVFTIYTRFPQFDDPAVSSLSTLPATVTYRQIVRLNNDGTLDATYGDGGVVTREIPIAEASRLGDAGIAVGADGSIFVIRVGGIGLPIDPATSPGVATAAGTPSSGDPGKPGVFAVTKLNADGTVDARYGTNGTATITTDLILSANNPGELVPVGRALADGSLILSGVANLLKDGRDFFAPYVVKVAPQGTLDASYGTKGQVAFPTIKDITGKQLNGSVNRLGDDAAEFRFASVAGSSGFTVLADGSAVGVLAAESTPTGAVVRIGKDGKFDPTFGKDGLAPIDSNYFLSVSRSNFADIDVLPATGGGYYLAGSTAAGFVVQKLTASGDVDLSFGRNGIAVLDAPFFIPDPGVFGLQARTKPLGGAFGNFEFSGADKIIVGGFLDEGKPTEAAFRSVFTRIDLNAPTPALPDEPKPFDVAANNVITEQQIGSDVGEVRFDLNGDGKAEIIRFERSKSGGSTSRFGIVDGVTGEAIVNNFRPYEVAYDGGLIVTGGDIDGDGKAELIVSPDVGGAARIQIFKLVDGRLVQSDNFFAIEDLAFRGGARVAAADLNGDGKADLVVSAGPGGGPRVALYDGADLSARKSSPRKLQGDFFAYTSESDLKLRNGVSVAVNDVNGDGIADLFVGAGVGGAPRLTIFDGKKLGTEGIEVARNAPLEDTFLGGDSTSRDGVLFLPKPTTDGAGNDVVVVNRGSGVQYLNGKSDPRTTLNFVQTVV